MELTQWIARLNLTWVLLWHSFMPRRSRDSMKLVWVFLEPIGQLAVLVILFSLIGRTGGYGRSFALFLLTGIVMLQIFVRGSAEVSRTIENANSSRRLPQIGLFQPALAAAAFQLITAAIYAPALAVVIWWWYRVDVVPHHPERVLLALGLCATLAFGVGLIRGYCLRFLPFVERIFKTLARGMLLISGIFFMPSWLPPSYREILIWNPLLHVIELNRLGVYLDYPTIVFSEGYLAAWALGSVAFGMALVWSVRRQLRE